MSQSKIEWTQSTLNVLAGCTPVSPGCAHCYVRRMTSRMMSLQNLYQTFLNTVRIRLMLQS
jgi:protein gp37